MNIDLKKRQSEFETRAAYKSVNFLKDICDDAINTFVDPEKHSLGNKVLRGIVKVLHNNYVDDNNLAPQLHKVEEQRELPAKITKIEEVIKQTHQQTTEVPPSTPQEPKSQRRV